MTVVRFVVDEKRKRINKTQLLLLEASSKTVHDSSWPPNPCGCDALFWLCCRF